MDSCYMPEEELDRRRSLFKAAAKGDVRAKQELEQEYHVRVYSPAERRAFLKRRT